MKTRMPIRSGAIFLALAALLVAPDGVRAEEIVVAESEMRIPCGKTGTWTVRPITPDEDHVYLEVNARLTSKRPYAGHKSSVMRIRVNGIIIARGRLKNRPTVFQYTVEGRKRRQGLFNGKTGAWLVVYSSDWKGADEQEKYPYGEAYRFVFDVTDLVSGADDNCIEIENLLTKKWAEKVGADKSFALVVKDVKMFIKPQEKSASTPGGK